MSWSEGSPSTHSGGGRICGVGATGIRRESSAPGSRARSSSPAYMAHLLQVGDVGSGAELFEHVIGAFSVRHERDAALRVLQVAEHDGLRGASLLAGRADVAVAERRLRLEGGVL